MTDMNKRGQRVEGREAAQARAAAAASSTEMSTPSRPVTGWPPIDGSWPETCASPPWTTTGT